MLRIAVPNKGMLSEPAWNMLAEAGYRLRSNPRQLVVEDPDNDVELFYLRPLDIAVYVGRGTIDVGITGHDLLVNSGIYVPRSCIPPLSKCAFSFFPDASHKRKMG